MLRPIADVNKCCSNIPLGESTKSERYMFSFVTYRLVEADHKAQMFVARNEALIHKLMDMIDQRERRQNSYPRNASHLALHALCSCTFSSASSAHLVNHKVHLWLMKLTINVMAEEDGDLPLRSV